MYQSDTFAELLLSRLTLIGPNVLPVLFNPTTEESTIVIVGDRARLTPLVLFAFILNCSLPSVLPSLTIFSVKDPVLLLIVTL